jgi:hypothetical protein
MVNRPLELVALDVLRPVRKVHPEERFVAAGRTAEGARD